MPENHLINMWRRLRALWCGVIRRKPRCTGWGRQNLAQIRHVVMAFICKNYQYSVLITKAWVPATIWYFQLYFTVARQGKFLLIVSDTPHYRSDIWNLNIGKYLASQSPYLSGLLRGQEMLSCGQRNEDILTQAGTCHTDNINGHSQPKHHTNHGVQPGVVLLHKEHQLHSAPFQIETKKSNLPLLCHLLQSAGLKLRVSFPSATNFYYF